MKITKPILRRTFRLLLLLGGLSVIAYLLYFQRLSSLLPGYSQAEIDTYRSAADWHTILNNPVNIFYKLPLWILIGLYHHGLVMTRIVAAGFGIVAVLLFFFVAKLRFSYWTALLGTLLFATSSGFLHSARLGTPQVLQMGVLLFMAALLWYRTREDRKFWAGALLAAVISVLTYIPGLIWLELFGIALLWPSIRRRLKVVPSLHIAGWFMIALVIALPLLIAAISHPKIGLEALGVPANWPSIQHYANNVLSAFLSIGIRSSGQPLNWVGHAPLLTIAEVVLVLVGVYERIFIKRNFRALYTIGSVGIGLLLIALGGKISFALLVPLLYMFVTEGLSQLMKQWLAVFPRNPIAHVLAVALIITVAVFTIGYHTRAYFVAWPHSTPTRQTFNRQLN